MNDVLEPECAAASAASAARWYAAHVRVNQEKTVANALTVRGLQSYVPVYREKRKWSDRVAELELPLFPGYVFCRMEPEKRLPVRMTPGVVRIVGSGLVPLPIDDAEIETVRFLVESGVAPQPYPSISIGDRVEIRGGPLSGVTGVLERINERRNLVVAITLLQRSVAVEIDDRWGTVKAERA